MLTSSFCHVGGINTKLERSLWDQGCHTWNDFLSTPDAFNIGQASTAYVVDSLQRSKAALESGEYQYFSKRLGLEHSWRAWPEFLQSCVYLDIETDGGFGGEAVTIIGLYDGSEFRAMVKDQDLGNFLDYISKFSMVVTFFGAGFDIPILEKKFKDWKCDLIHLDLCKTMRNLGYKGGLKSIERQLGITRVDDAVGLDGKDAIRLWRLFMHGDEKALETLIAYNREDVVNMEVLAKVAYEGMRAKVFPLPTAPDYG